MAWPRSEKKLGGHVTKGYRVDTRSGSQRHRAEDRAVADTMRQKAPQDGGRTERAKLKELTGLGPLGPALGQLLDLDLQNALSGRSSYEPRSAALALVCAYCNQRT